MTRLSLRDKVALIYTSAGSARAIADLAGVSDRTIRRILHAGEPGHAPRQHSPAIVAAIDSAFEIHKQVTREQAKVDGLPFDPAIPIFIQRMEYTPFENVPTGFERAFVINGKLVWKTEYKRVPQRDKNGKLVVIRGDRILADHTHWIPDSVRNAWLGSMQKTGAFLQVSVSSMVDLILYNRQADLRYSAATSNETQRANAESILRTIEKNIQKARIFTRYTSLHKSFSVRDIAGELDDNLRRKHQPATGKPGTRLSDQYLLQTDSRNVKQANFRDRHPIPPKRRKKKND